MARKRNQEIDYLPEYDFLPDAVEVFERPPSPLGRLVVWMIGAFALITLLWLIFSKTDVVVTTTGKIIPSGNVKTIQAASEGVVEKIHVRDGQAVQKDDLLLELDTTLSQAEREKLEQEYIKSELEVRRISAQIAGETDFDTPENSPTELVQAQRALLLSQSQKQAEKIELAISEVKRYEADYAATDSEVRKLEQTLPILKKKYDDTKRNAEEGLIAGTQVTDAEIRYIEARRDLEIKRHRLQEVAANLQSSKDKQRVADSEYLSDLNEKLAEATHQRNTARQELIKATQRNQQQQIKAPVSGIVQQLAIHTEGGVVRSADSLLVIVPEDAGLEIEAKILNRDIGFINPDQPVLVKVDAYEFTRYGMIEATVKWVGRDAIVDEQLGPVYPARIILDRTVTPNTVAGRQGVLTPGMTVVNDVVIGQRRLIEYFLGPILRYKDESLRER